MHYARCTRGTEEHVVAPGKKSLLVSTVSYELFQTV